MSIDLTTNIGELRLRSPIIVGSCPMTTDEMQRVSMISNGVGAIVLPSCQPDRELEYLNQLSSIANQDDVPVIASIRTGMEDNHWFDLPLKLERGGAAAIEISLDVCSSEVLDPRKFEQEICELAQRAGESIDIPLLLKLTPNFTSISHLAKSLYQRVEALIMFGRHPIIDIELDSLAISKQWGLTQPGSVVHALEPMMRTKHSFPDMSLITCGGVGSSEDLIKAILAGADAVMVTSAIYRNGVASLGSIRDGLIKYMCDRGVNNLHELRALCPSIDDGVAADSTGSIEVSIDDTVKTIDPRITGDRFGHPVT